ncbi:MAG TPA: DUF2809 domain-containing protein [Flavobacteriales bacterium]|nr:DUF2809 domain-containing protein [Flavobacteriales bacterium]
MKPPFRFSLPHALVAVLLLSIELLIAFGVRQPFIRFHLGDLLVAGLMHFSIRALFDWPAKRVAIGVLLFALAVEGMQAAGLIHHLGLSHDTWAKLLMGNTFQWMDLIMYALGAIAACALDMRLIRLRKDG